MTNANSKLYADIEALSATDKLMLVEWILRSLDRPDPEFDQIWLAEAEKRLDGYEKGQIKAIELNTVLNKYRGSNMTSGLTPSSINFLHTILASSNGV